MSTKAALRELRPSPSFLATRQGKLTLDFLCMVGFLDFVDAACSIFLVAAAAIALRATNTRGEPFLEAVPATESA